MTLVIGAQGSDFLILGADSRVLRQDISGTRIELNTAVKLIKINSRVAILIYGDAHLPDYLIDTFTEHLPATPQNVTHIAREFADHCRQEALRTKDVPRDYFPRFAFIIAGLDETPGGILVPYCYKLRSIDGFQLGRYSEGFAIGGKDVIATYLFSKKYKIDMSVDDLSALVAEAINDTTKIDGDVGGEIKMVRIDCNGYKEYSTDIVESYIEGQPLEDIASDLETESPN